MLVQSEMTRNANVKPPLRTYMRAGGAKALLLSSPRSAAQPSVKAADSPVPGSSDAQRVAYIGQGSLRPGLRQRSRRTTCKLPKTHGPVTLHHSRARIHYAAALRVIAQHCKSDCEMPNHTLQMQDDTYDAAPPPAPPAHADADAAGDEPEPKRWPDPDPNACAESFGTGIENATEEPRTYREGEEVDVFYRALEEDTGGYFPCADSTDNLCGPRVARSDGWVPAVVERAHHGWDGEQVLVRHAWPHWREPGGRPLDMSDDRNSVQRFAPYRVRPRSEKPEKPSLDILLVRWGGKEDPDACAGQYSGSWGSAGAVVSDRFASGLLDFIHWKLGCDYGACAAYVTSGQDLERLCERRITQMLEGKHVAAFYLLWPARFDDGTAGRPGMVPADSLLELMRRVESAGVPTRFPHAAHVYRALLAKEWTTAVSGCGPSQMRVPATTRVAASSVARVPFSAAKRAVDALRAIKGDECDRGVVKLGYSWEALDVRAWRGVSDLAGALVDVLHQPGCRARHVFVQE